MPLEGDLMATVSDVARWLEDFAPARLAESWDNVGLLWGDPDTEIARVMTCLTVTPTTASEAIEERAGLIVSHHPVLFRAVKKIRADLAETGFLWNLARAGIAIASPHTAFDNTHQGINDILCERLGLVDVKPLRPIGPSAIASRSFKVVVFTPEPDREAVLSAAFAAGAGQIGAYEQCSFAIPGEGTFFGTESANPVVGERGRRETVSELCLEFVCPAQKLAQVLAAIGAHHSYEQPAIDVFALHDCEPEDKPLAGVARVGRLTEPRALAEFARFVGRALGGVTVAMAGPPRRAVQNVAVACGAGDDFLKDAALVGADVLVTGEARFHRAIEAEALGIGLLTAGHYATERLGIEELAGRIALAFPNLTVWPSQSERDPLIWVDTREAISLGDG
jgi:dinuclear metal center YbgI/SA1388 family protein